MAEPLIRGEVVFDPPPTDLTGAKVYIRLEQTSLVDMPSRVVSEQTLSDLSARLVEGHKIPFTVYGPKIDIKERYNLSAHVDWQGDGIIRPGDYINMQSYPVLTYGYSDQVIIQVRKVKAANEKYQSHSHLYEN